jgi:hypothetical protein
MYQVKVETQSAHIIDTAENNKLSISSYLTHIKNTMTAYRWFGYLVQSLGTPIVTQTVPTTLATMTNLAVGKGFLLTDSSTRIPYNHALGMTEYPGQITKMAYDLDKSKIKTTYRLSPYYTYGWAPAALIEADSSTKDGSGQITCTTTLREYNRSDGPVDCMFFDCYTYSPSKDEYIAKSCSCGDYKVIAARLDTDSNIIMSFNVTSVASDGTLVLEDQSDPTNYNLWNTTKRHVIFFDEWDNCEDCQKKWIFFSDSNGKLGSADNEGFRWI